MELAQSKVGMVASKFNTLRNLVFSLPFALLAVGRTGTIQDVEHGMPLYLRTVIYPINLPCP